MTIDHDDVRLHAALAEFDTSALEVNMLIKEARRRQRVRWLAVVATLVAMSGVAVYLAAGRATSPTKFVSLTSRPLHYPTLGPNGSCPTSPGKTFNNDLFGGVALGSGPVRVLLADSGDLRHGHVNLFPSEVRGWSALQTLWFAEPGYNGPFVVRAERIGRSAKVEVQPGRNGLEPGAGPLLVSAGPTMNTAGGYRTVPGSTWVKSGGCYAWQVDGRNFSEVIVFDALT